MELMEELRTGFLVVFLAVCSNLDIRAGQLPLWFLLMGAVVGTLLEIIENGMGMAVFWNLFPGLILFLAALAIPEQIGTGDGWMLMGAGALGGWAEGLFLFGNGLLFMFPVAFFQVIIRKKRKKELPFAPFMLAACLCSIVR